MGIFDGLIKGIIKTAVVLPVSVVTDVVTLGGELTDKLRRHVRLLSVLDRGVARELAAARPGVGRAQAQMQAESLGRKAQLKNPAQREKVNAGKRLEWSRNGRARRARRRAMLLGAATA